MYFEDAVDEVLAEVKKVLISRQKKYGSGNINHFGAMGVVVRLFDKMERLKRYYFSSDKQAREDTPDESLDDTWIDVVGYGSIAMMLRRDIWGLPLLEGSDPPPAEPDQS